MKRKAVAEADSTIIHFSEENSKQVDLALLPPLSNYTEPQSSRPLEDPHPSPTAEPSAPSAVDTDADQDAGRDDNGAAEPVGASTVRKAPPVLPWMRVPVSIEAGTGIPLKDVRGLNGGLLSALRAGVLGVPPT